MVTDKIKQLKATQAKMAELEKSIATQLARELAGLPAKYGFGTVQAFVQAVKAASGGKRRVPAAKKKAGGKRRKRAVITAETKAEMKRILEEIQNGSFAREWLLENKVNAPAFKAMRRREIGV